jgi:hypothetical protein
MVPEISFRESKEITRPGVSKCGEAPTVAFDASCDNVERFISAQRMNPVCVSIHRPGVFDQKLLQRDRVGYLF